MQALYVTSIIIAVLWTLFSLTGWLDVARKIAILKEKGIENPMSLYKVKTWSIVCDFICGFFWIYIIVNIFV